MYYGLVVAWEKGVRRLEVEVDSMMVMEFLTIGIGDTHPLSFLVRLCHGFLTRDWLVRFVHVYREANRLADGLANLAFSLPFGFHSFVVAPIEVVVLVHEDVDVGATTNSSCKLKFEFLFQINWESFSHILTKKNSIKINF